MATATALTLVPLQAANAEPAPVTGVELGTSLSNAVAVNARFDFSDAETVGLPALRRLRAEMWDINPAYVPYGSEETGTRLQDIARKNGLTTKDAYVNAFQIDPDLTRIAVQRAAEQPLGSLTHDRAVPAAINGKSASGEALALGRNLEGAILQAWGHGELRALQSAGGEWNLSNGHLHYLLNPANRSFGFGHVSVYANGSFYEYTAGISASAAASGASLPAGKQELNLYRPARSGETPTGEQPFRAPAKPNLGNTVGTGVSGSSADVKTIISIISAVITLISVLAGVAQQFMR